LLVPVRRSTRIARTSALTLAFALTGLLSAPVHAARPLVVHPSAVPSASPAASCPPDWLGHTSNTEPQVSANGRFVVFTGYSPDSETGDRVIFLRDVRRGTTTVVSDPARVSYNFAPSISNDGNRISYLRRDVDDFDNDAELYVYDRRTGARSLEGSAFTQYTPDLSADGRLVTFTSLENGNTNLVQVYVRDVDTDVTRLVSATPAGQPGDHTSLEPTISDSGRFVLFWSEATDLTTGSGGAGNTGAIFVRDLRTGTTTVVPDRNGGVSANYLSGQRLSPDGRYVVYRDPTGVWRYDRRTHRTVAASQAYGVSQALAVSAQGREVAFTAPDALIVRNVRTGHETSVNVGPDGTVDPTADFAYLGGLTPNGRYVVFYTTVQTLDPRDPGDSNLNVYLRDLRRGRTTLVSSSHAGGECEA
jgi:Tol biopolymer transport system component